MGGMTYCHCEDCTAPDEPENDVDSNQISLPALREAVTVPDIPGPRRPQCWRQDPVRLIRCDRARNHSGLHSWELAEAREELTALRQGHAELEAKLEQAPSFDLTDCCIIGRGENLWLGPHGNRLTLLSYRIEPKEHHAEAVRSAFYEGRLTVMDVPSTPDQTDAAWLASQAKARLT